MDGNKQAQTTLIVLLVAAAIVTATITLCGPEALSQSAATVIAIGKMDVGSTPADFKFGRTGQGKSGQWTVVSDQTSFEGRLADEHFDGQSGRGTNRSADGIGTARACDTRTESDFHVNEVGEHGHSALHQGQRAETGFSEFRCARQCR